MHPRTHFKSRPDHAAIVMAADGQVITYAELECRANQGAHFLRSLGLCAGDALAVLIDNSVEFLQIYWAAQRCGLYFTPISTRCSPGDAAYIVKDCGARVLLLSANVGESATTLASQRENILPGVQLLSVGQGIPELDEWGFGVSQMPITAIADESAGTHMVYSSGTTGRPKGIKLPLSGGPAFAAHPYSDRHRQTYGVGEHTVYLSPAPLYHTAPLVFSTIVQRLGGTVVIMDRFDPEAWLDAIQRYRISFSQMVPTMFVRLLKLDEGVRMRYDLSSLEMVVHAAAPCPVPVKAQMLQWLGPIIAEYYGGSEANGGTFITPAEWLRKPGSVGKPNWGAVHIVGEDGDELAPGETGLVYFEGGLDFKYHNDPQKTAEARHPVHTSWTTLGDIGHVDEDGYLFLTDRKAFTIISGGVNIYPQEIENLLVSDPRVADAAVIGIPSRDLGEEVKAIVQPADWSQAGPDLARQLLTLCRDKLSLYKCPRSIDFNPALPRGDNGKLYKKELRDSYWT